jgi:hypothetical protein
MTIRLPENATAIQQVAYDALMIQEGACNPSGIARQLVKTIDAVRDLEVRAKDHPAVRLVLHQLVWIVYGADIAIGSDGPYRTWNEDMDACRALLAPMAEASDAA